MDHDGDSGVAAHTVVLIVDPGLPERVADVSRLLCRALSRHLSSRIPWRVRVRAETLPLDRAGEIRLMNRSDSLRAEENPGHVIYLTDLPRRMNDEPVVYHVDVARTTALVSLPALGALRTRSRVVKALTEAMIDMAGGEYGVDRRSARRRGARYVPLTRYESGTSEEGPYMLLVGMRGRLRLLLGMVRCNRPARLLRALSSSIAAAVATGAFGVFYASVWNLADASSLWRLAVICVMAVFVLTTWLIVRNGLWNSRGANAMDPPGRSMMDNASTTVTVMLSVALLYGILFAILSIAAAVAIPPTYLRSQLGHAVDVRDYVQLSWLASSLGAFAGALGSNFDSDEAIRAATYGRRENERRKLNHDDEQ